MFIAFVELHPFHTTFGNFDCIPRSQKCQLLTDFSLIQLGWHFVGLLITSSSSCTYHYFIYIYIFRICPREKTYFLVWRENKQTNKHSRCLFLWHCWSEIVQICLTIALLHHHHLSLNHEGRWLPQMISQPVSSFSLFSSALWDLANSRPVHFPMMSFHLFFPLSLCLARWFWPDLMNARHVHANAVCVFYDGQEVFVWSDCLLNLGTDFLVGNTVFVWDV